MLSGAVVWPFVGDMRDARRFLATAHATTGVVADRHTRGSVLLVVDGGAAGRTGRIHRTGRNPLVGTPAFRERERGDSIPVHFQPSNPDVALVRRPGPDRRALVESLAKLWVVCGALLAAYLPLAARGLRERAEATWAPLRERMRAATGAWRGDGWRAGCAVATGGEAG